MIEEKRVEFEDILTEKIAKMNTDLAKLLRRVRDDFARYGDYDKVSSYCDVSIPYLAEHLCNVECLLILMDFLP